MYNLLHIIDIATKTMTSLRNETRYVFRYTYVYKQFNVN